MNMIRELYDIDLRLEECSDPETGELLDAEEFEALHMERAELIDGLASWLKSTRALSNEIKEELDRQQKRYQAVMARVNDLKALLDHFLDGEKFVSARNVVTFRRSTSVRIDDEVALREWAESSGFDDCIRYTPPSADVNRSAVKKLLERSVIVPGASLEQRRNVTVK